MTALRSPRALVWAVVLGGLCAILHDTAGDWSIFLLAHRLFAGAPLHIYAQAPVIQIGPPAMVVGAGLAGLPGGHAITEVVIALIGLYVVCRLDGLRTDLGDRRADRFALYAGVVLMGAWAWVVAVSHIDDALAMLFLVEALAAVLRRGSVAAGAWIGAAVLVKPWALGCLLVLLGLPTAAMRLRGLVVAVVIQLGWLPWLLGDRHTLTALRNFHLPVAPTSRLHGLGVPIDTIWTQVRPAQAGLGLLLALVLAARGHWRAALLAGLAARVLLDPNGPAYYDAEIALGTVVLDFARPRQAPSWTLTLALPLIVVSWLLRTLITRIDVSHLLTLLNVVAVTRAVFGVLAVLALVALAARTRAASTGTPAAVTS